MARSAVTAAELPLEATGIEIRIGCDGGVRHRGFRAAARSAGLNRAEFHTQALFDARDDSVVESGILLGSRPMLLVSRRLDGAEVNRDAGIDDGVEVIAARGPVTGDAALIERN